MGVQGLATFIDAHGRIYREEKFRQRRLIIDGFNLVHELYDRKGLDCIHGGDYAALEAQIERFIKALTDCGVTPYVVMDGGSDHTDKKSETCIERRKDRIRRAHQAAVSGSGHYNVLPMFSKLVFRQTLVRLGVQVAMCYEEADQEIAALASEWQCPVLSNDSDFYIFPLPAGLLPISHFHWEGVGHSQRHSFIPCKRYYTSSFCLVHELKPGLLPTFAALAGNDYVKLQSSALETAGPPSRLEGLLGFLRPFLSPQDAMEAALGLMGNLGEERRREVERSLRLGLEEYTLPPSALKKFFIHRAPPPFTAEMSALLPDWLRLPLTQSVLTSDIVDVLQTQTNGLHIAVDHKDKPSAQDTAKPLRQVLYGLLLGAGGLVEERDREGLQLKFIQVPAVCRGLSAQLTLHSLDKSSPCDRMAVLLGALGVSEACLSALPASLRLPLAVSCYWLQRAEPPPDRTLLRALLLGMSHGHAPRGRAAFQIQNQPKLDLDVTHSLNQWQGCLKDAIKLNQLLCSPLPEPQIARLYEGSLVHEMAHRLQSGIGLKGFMPRNPSSVKLYQTMLKIVDQFHHATDATGNPSQPQSNPTSLASSRRQPLEDLTMHVQQLFLSKSNSDGDGDDETEVEASSAVRAEKDLYLQEMVSVKTRFKSKERNNRCHNPELSRKEERRGRDLL